TSMMVVNPQLYYPATPAEIKELSFRQALIYAIDRQQMVDTIEYGLVSVAHGVVYPTLAEGTETDSAVVRYEYDPRRAAQLVESFGYTKGPDNMYRDPRGIPLKIEIRAT